nr:oligopeptide:H+ symporter [Calditrichia bacterium]
MFKKHPKGLTLLFSTELWERFSYYGMRALLVLYMTKALDYSDPKALGVYGAYGALVYATPLLGGLLADRILGQRNSIVLGAILMTLGHFMMAFDTIITFYTALGLLVVGNGFFKPNMAPLLGKLYRDDDPLREGAFTIFYMGVNIGAFVAPLACGELAKIFGWHAGFSLAGFGMLFGLVIFYGQQKIFGKDGLPPSSGTRPLLAGLTPLRLVWIGAFLSIPFFALLMNQSEIMSYLLFVLGVVALGYVAYNGFRVSKIEGARLLVAM